MEKIKYKDFERMLNNGEILEANFSVKDYNHYKYCKVIYVPNKDGDENLFLPYIEFTLTKDGSEYARFHKRFNGAEKIFHIKKMSQTLAAIWKSVEFTYIEFNSGERMGNKDY